MRKLVLFVAALTSAGCNQVAPAQKPQVAEIEKPCDADCAAHKAGYELAKTKSGELVKLCESKGKAFAEGCRESFDEQVQEAIADDSDVCNFEDDRSDEDRSSY